MSKFRETPCKYYECRGVCAMERDADYKGYCQHCDEYEARGHVKHENMKKKKIRKFDCENTDY